MFFVYVFFRFSPIASVLPELLTNKGQSSGHHAETISNVEGLCECLMTRECITAVIYLLICLFLSVPLDYFNASSGNASLALARYPATNKTARLGTLLTNPGGPGGSGVNYIYRAGKRISDVLGGRYDIVSIIYLLCLKKLSIKLMFRSVGILVELMKRREKRSKFYSH